MTMTKKEFMDKWELSVYSEETGEVSCLSLAGAGLRVTIRKGYAGGAVIGWLDYYTVWKTSVVQGTSASEVYEKMDKILTSWDY